MKYRYVWFVWSSAFLVPWLARYLARPAFRRRDCSTFKQRSDAMKRPLIAVALTAAALAAQPLWSGAQAPEKPAAKPRAGVPMDPKMREQMMERMKQMQAQMDRIRQSTDPAERQKLMAEHMKSMQETMQMMRGMGGGMMMGGGAMMGGPMMGEGMKGGGRGPSPEMMEMRMDMMHMMMEHMMQHQQMMQQPMKLPAK